MGLLARPLLVPVGPAPLRLALGGVVLVADYALVLLYVMGQKAFYVDLLQRLLRRSTPEAAA